MYTDNNSTIPDKLTTSENKNTFITNFKLDKNGELESTLNRDCSLEFIEGSGALDFLSNKSNNNYCNFIQEIINHNHMPSHVELISLGRSNLFTNTKKNSVLVRNEENRLKRKRGKKRRPRKENQDNIRRKIKRGFFNNSLIKKLNEKLQSIKIIKYFEKFPQHFVNDVNRKRNKDILNLTLREIFEKKELYSLKDKLCLYNYLHNLEVLESEDIKDNEEFKKIFNKTFRELYEEYINSDEFEKDEINRLKKKNEDEYISKYIYLAKYLLEYFTQ